MNDMSGRACGADFISTASPLVRACALSARCGPQHVQKIRAVRSITGGPSLHPPTSAAALSAGDCPMIHWPLAECHIKSPSAMTPAGKGSDARGLTRTIRVPRMVATRRMLEREGCSAKRCSKVYCPVASGGDGCAAPPMTPASSATNLCMLPSHERPKPDAIAFYPLPALRMPVIGEMRASWIDVSSGDVRHARSVGREHEEVEALPVQACFGEEGNAGVPRRHRSWKAGPRRPGRRITRACG